MPELNRELQYLSKPKNLGVDSCWDERRKVLLGIYWYVIWTRLALYTGQWNEH